MAASNSEFDSSSRKKRPPPSSDDLALLGPDYKKLATAEEWDKQPEISQNLIFQYIQDRRPAQVIAKRSDAKIHDEYTRISWIQRKSLKLDLIWADLSSWMASFTVRSMVHAEYGYIIISGGSGAGKTRAGLELGRLLGPQISSFGWQHIHVFSTVSQAPNTPDDVDSPESIFSDAPDQTYEKPEVTTDAEKADAISFIQRRLCGVYSISADVPIDTLLPAIRIAEKVPEKTPLLVLFQVDEFQWALPFCTHLSRTISILSTAADSPFVKHDVLLLPVFTGTSFQFINLSTDPQCRQVVLSGFDTRQDARHFFEDAWEVAKTHYLGQIQAGKVIPPLSISARSTRFLDSPVHTHMLYMLGFIPRMIIAYARTLCSLNGGSDYLDIEVHFKSIWTSVTSSISKLRKLSSIDTSTRDHIMVLWYFQIPVLSTHPLNGHTVAQLQAYSYYYLREVEPPSSPDATAELPPTPSSSVALNTSTSSTSEVDAPKFYALIVPFVYCRVWYPDLFGHDIFERLGQFTETGMPEFVARLHYATYHMLDKLVTTANRLQAKLSAHPELIPDVMKDRKREVKGGASYVVTSRAEIYNYAIFEAALPKGESLPDPDDRIFVTPPKYHGADLACPHAAEQYKSSRYFTKTGDVDDDNHSLTPLKLKQELDKDTFHRPLTLITLQPVPFVKWDEQTQSFHWKVDGRPSVTVDQDGTQHKKKPGGVPNKVKIEFRTQSLLVIDSADDVIALGRGLIHSPAIQNLENADKSVTN